MHTAGAGPDGGALLIDDERAARAAQLLRGRLPSDGDRPLDASDAALGVELAANRIERGPAGFYPAALSISAALGADPTRLRRWLRSWYEGARALLEDHGRAPADMDPPETVRDAIGMLGGGAGAPPAATAPPAEALSGAVPAPAPVVVPAAPRAAPDPAPARIAPVFPRDPDAPAPGAPVDAPIVVAAEDPAETGLFAAVRRAEAAAGTPAQPCAPERDDASDAAPGPGPLPWDAEDAPDAEDEAALRDLLNRRRRRKGERRTKLRRGDVLWGALLVPGVIVGLSLFGLLISIPPLSWLTGLAYWEMSNLVETGMLALGLWLCPLTLIAPPLLLVWRRGRSLWLWMALVAPLAFAFLVFMSALIVIRSPSDPEFVPAALRWAQVWGPAVAAVAASMLLGPRLRRFNRHAFRRIGGWFDARGQKTR